LKVIQGLEGILGCDALLMLWSFHLMALLCIIYHLYKLVSDKSIYGSQNHILMWNLMNDLRHMDQSSLASPAPSSIFSMGLTSIPPTFFYYKSTSITLENMRTVFQTRKFSTAFLNQPQLFIQRPCIQKICTLHQSVVSQWIRARRKD
jgi:hypothetical protein